jgi:hypothetical protein
MASTRLTRTVGAGNRQTWTFSCWLKRTKITTSQMIMGTYVHAADNFRIYFTDTDKLVMRFYNNTEYLIATNRRFRDTNAWYHLVFVADNTNATSTDRFRMYVNGVRETSFSSQSQPTQNLNMSINDSNTLEIGSFNNADFIEGCMSHINFVDGTALDASSFGSTDSTTGEWKINTSPSVTYGTNGFFILKDGNSVTDQSGNSNNFTVAGGTLTNTEDCPSNVFCTWNRLVVNPYALSYYRGNLDISAEGNNWYCTLGTLGFSQGKFYFECNDLGEHSQIGVTNPGINMNLATSLNAAGTTVFYNADGGEMRKDGTATTADYGTFNSTDIMGVAIDMDGKTMSIYKNGSAIVTNYALSTSITDAAIPYVALYGSGNLVKFNFGNGYFGTTAISSEGTNASGLGKFEYDVPTGYTALCTKGLNE